MKFLDKRLDRRIAAYQQELIETHYREVENMYRQMRGWRHDFRNHIQLLAAYAQKGDLEAVKSYLAELEQDLARVEPTVKTGNAMADAILNSKISLAKAKGIPVRADAHIPVKLSISDLDLCVILGNLFDNAIEASQQLPEGRAASCTSPLPTWPPAASGKRWAGGSPPPRGRATALGCSAWTAWWSAWAAI